jgi:hypothetical protein
LSLGNVQYMRAKLEAVSGYDTVKDSFDLIALINAIKGLIYHFEGYKCQPMGMYLVHTHFYNLSQSRDTTDAQFLEKFMTCVSVIEQYGGIIGRYREGTWKTISPRWVTLRQRAQARNKQHRKMPRTSS